MKLAALAAAALLAPSLTTAPPEPPEVVTVSVIHPTGPPDRATGCVAGDDLVVTVAHVLGGGDGVVAGSHGVVARGDALVGGRAQVTVGGRRASVVRVDPGLDLALLRVPGVRGEPLRTATDVDRTTLAGRPAPVVRRISARLDGGAPRPALELRAEVSAGDSGAPLVTPTGRVAGVVFARSRARPSIAYAVDASALARVLR